MAASIILFLTSNIVDILYVSDGEIINAFMIYLLIRFFSDFIKFLLVVFLKKNCQ